MRTIPPHFHGVGAAFFPEHHPREMWERHADLMAEAGLSMCRLAEFTWDKLEPQEGVYDFSWLDEVLALLDARGLRAIMCTPTAVPPIWACRKYPDLHPVEADGKVFGWGIRRYTCPTSLAYRALCEGICRAQAAHYGASAQILAWQIDNEIGHPFCFCPRCLRGFQDWCHERWGTVEAFNDAHCTHFLGQTVQQWSEIAFPTTSPSPSLWLSYHRFFSAMTVDCFALQARVLREAGATQPVTTNLMTTWGGYDHEAMAEHLDFIAGDDYTLGRIFGDDFVGEAFTASYLKGLKPGDNLWYHEMQFAPNGAGNPLPGQTRWWTLVKTGLGADVLNFFRWDTCPSGIERDAFGLLKPHAEPGRIYHELTQVAHDLRGLAPLLDGTTVPPAEVGLLYTYENQWEFFRSPKLPEFADASTNGYALQLAQHYRALTEQQIPVDVVYPGQDFSGYRLLVAPLLYVLSAELGEKLAAYVRSGGQLLLTGFSGIADENARMWYTPAPGPLREAFGLRVLDYGSYFATMGDLRLAGTEAAPGLPELPVRKWVEEITPDPGTEVLGVYAGPHLAGTPAFTRREVGEGVAWYLGTVLDTPEWLLFYRWLAERVGLKRLWDLPPGVFLTRREKPGTTLWFLSNQEGEPREVTLPGRFRDVIGERDLSGTLTLAPFEALVLTHVG